MVNLVKKTLNLDILKVVIPVHQSRGFPVEMGVRQGDAFSYLLFKIDLERGMMRSIVNTRESIFRKSI